MRQIQRKIYSDEIKYGFGLYSILSIMKDFELSKDDCNCDYEMVCKTSDYFSEKKIVSEIIIKFRMEDPKKKYHLPIIISPNGYSIWWSQ